MGDFPMRTGFGQEVPSDDLEDRRLLAAESTVAYIVSKALDSALTFAQHAGRTRITSYDLVPALKYEAMVLYNDENMVSEIQNIMNTLEEDESGSESSDVEEETEEEPALKDIVPNTCECTTCTNIRSAHRNWGRWNTTDTLQLSVQRAINRLCDDEMLEFPEMI